MMKFLRNTSYLLVLAMICCYSSVDAQSYIFMEPENGITVIEGEHYYDLIEGSGDFAGEFWAVATDNAGFTGTGYIAAPDVASGIGDGADAVEVGPAVVYRINITQPGAHFFYARCSYQDGASDSYHIGTGDTLAFNKMNPYTEIAENFDQWGWSSVTAGGSQAVLDFPTAGEHNLVIYMREGRFRLDKIVLLTEDVDPPSGLGTPGPDETIFTGIKETYLTKTLRVFPNPAEDFTVINFDVQERGNLKAGIYNLSGQLITVLMDREVVPGYEEIIWNVGADSNVSPGMYFLKIDHAGGSAVRKIVVD